MIETEAIDLFEGYGYSLNRDDDLVREYRRKSRDGLDLYIKFYRDLRVYAVFYQHSDSKRVLNHVDISEVIHDAITFQLSEFNWIPLPAYVEKWDSIEGRFQSLGYFKAESYRDKIVYESDYEIDIIGNIYKTVMFHLRQRPDSRKYDQFRSYSTGFSVLKPGEKILEEEPLRIDFNLHLAITDQIQRIKEMSKEKRK